VSFASAELRPTRAEISLDALEANYSAIRDWVRPRAVLGVVKANAYGHGAVPVARCLQRCGIDHLAVALLEEAAELRGSGINIPILVMGALEPEQMEAAARYEVTPALFREDQLVAFEQRSCFPANRIEHHCFTAIEPDEKARLHIRAIGQEHACRCDEIHPDKFGRHRHQIHLVGVAPHR